jgi:3D (Asp-Asp-Asp) domain-containing protein
VPSQSGSVGSPTPGERSVFIATAYCQGTITAGGTDVTEGIVAADPTVLPLGTVIRVAGLTSRYNRLYHVMDTGRKIQGHRIDLYISDCGEAVQFGRRRAEVSLLPIPPRAARQGSAPH